MTHSEYELIEKYMLKCMSDSAHDTEHIYRVLNIALDIAEHESNVDFDVLIAACLLHDISRKEQYENPELNHAVLGSEKAYNFLTQNGFKEIFASRVASCIIKHSFRNNNMPTEIEEKILFDADKIDSSGTIGIARTLLYKGFVGNPLYSRDLDGNVSDGSNDKSSSFFHEYKFKLEKLYTRFFTARGQEIAFERQNAAVSFYNDLYNEVQATFKKGKILLDKHIN